MRKCVCSECIKHMCRFSHFSWIANTRRPKWSEGHLHFRQTKPLDAYKHLWSTMLLPLQDVVATVYETAAGIEIRESCLTIVLPCKMRHLSDQTLWDNLPHGWLFWLLLGVYRHLPVTMNLMILLYTLAKSEKQRRWGAVRHWHFPWGFIGKCSFGCMHQTFARCLVMVQKSFGPTFTHVSGAPEAPVSCF